MSYEFLVPVNVSVIIFDFGGTLDTGGRHWAHVLFDAYRKAGVDISWEKFMDVYVATERRMEKEKVVDRTDSMRMMLEKKIALHNLDTSITDEVYNIVRTHAEKSRRVLLELKQRARLAVVSNFYGNLQTVLEELNLADLFDVVTDSTVVGIRKPDPRIFAVTIEQMNAKPENVIVVGDSMKNDILPAQELGVAKCVMVNGNDNGNDKVNENFVKINDINQLLCDDIYLSVAKIQ